MSLQRAIEKQYDFTSRDRFNALNQVDWSFDGRTRQDELEVIHPYPAKFIPELPGTLLDKLGLEPGTAVLDPFVGSGTTLVEAQRRGLKSVGIDVNPIACLISRVRTSPKPEGLEDAAAAVVARCIKNKTVPIPNIPNLAHWFTRPVAETVAPLVHAINQAPEQYRDALRVSLSSILVRVSNQDSDTRYAAVKKQVTSAQVISLFESACSRLARALDARGYNLPPSLVLEHDVLAMAPSAIPLPIGAVITSPPYPNAYEYWLYHKYRMWWLGYDPLSVKAQEIGARAHFFKANPHTEENFVQQMRKTFSLIAQVLRQDGYVCFVVGRSRIHGRTINNAQLIEDTATEFGYKAAFTVERIIQPNRKSFNLSHANIKTETILVLTK